MKLLFVISLLMLTQLPSTALGYETAYDFRMPLDGNWTVTQDFGVWNSTWGGYHLGEDVLRSTEAAVYAPANGRVKHARSRTGFGYVVVIEHRLPDGTHVCTVMGHMRAANIIGEEVDVAKGQLIGYLSSDPSENGGYSFIHNHFGIRTGTYVFWQYPGYGNSTELANWYDPSDFVNSHAAPPFAVQYIDQNYSLVPWMAPGQTIPLWVKYRNVGSITWEKHDGVSNPNYVELRSLDDAIGCDVWSSTCAYHTSWINRQRIVSFQETTVPPNSIGTFSFTAEAPDMTGTCMQYAAPYASVGCVSDWAGMHFILQVDGTPPTVPGTPAAVPTYNNSNSFSFSWGASSDGHSGFKQYNWRVNSGAKSGSTTATSLPASNYATQQGENTFEVQAEDIVGNKSGWSTATFTWDPGGCGPLPPWPPCIAAASQPAEPNIVQSIPGQDQILPLLQRSVNEWAIRGQSTVGVIPGDIYCCIGFSYRTLSEASFGWALSAENTGIPGLSLPETTIKNPISDGEWHPFWSAPFWISAEQLEKYPTLIFSAGQDQIGKIEIDNVQVYRSDIKVSR